MNKTLAPILEFDPQRKAVIEPAEVIPPVEIGRRCVLCFFGEVVEQIAAREGVRRVTASRSEMGLHPIYELTHQGERVAFLQAGVGAPLSAGLLEEAIARGCRTFVACGSAGVLAGEIASGHIVVPIAAVRDEGTSYHYLPPAREVHPSPEAVAAIERVLERHRLPYVVGKTWTTDAFYRETPSKVRRRRDEGCLTVEMEAAALFAVARFREVTLGYILYAGDDVSGEAWDPRDWTRNASLRERLFWLAVEAVLEIAPPTAPHD